jgi:hypothetical protein
MAEVVREDQGVERAIKHRAQEGQALTRLLVRHLHQAGGRSVGPRKSVDRLPGIGELPTELVVLAPERVDVAHEMFPP